MQKNLVGQGLDISGLKYKYILLVFRGTG